jgi:nucleotide-binding universal stress UspA family protein
MSRSSFYRAILDFRRARSQANRELLKARLTGKSASLLPYEDVRQMLRAHTGQRTGPKDIPLEAIVGSVDRYTEFTRSFLPLEARDEERWARIQLKFNDLQGLPPIEVYQIGQVYFVQDGNHRVSVARQMGATHIDAYVTEVETKVPLSPDVQASDLIVKAEYAGFLAQTRLDEIRPEANLTVTVPGQVEKLLEQIEIHRDFLSVEEEREIPYTEAVARWYDEIYLPAVKAIRELGILEAFDRTETDLYLWVSEHRHALEEALGWEVEPEEAAADLAGRFGPGVPRRIARSLRQLLEILTPDELESGPRAGAWRRERLAIHRDDCMFAQILVPVSGEARGWPAVAQAVEIACRENARLLGLHVVPSAADRESDRVQAIRAEFARQCQALGVEGRMAVEVGRVARRICERSRWADLIVIEQAHPPALHRAPTPRRALAAAPEPGDGPGAWRSAGARLSSGFATLLRRCSTPVLAVPGAFSPLNRPLLAYDGSPKATEALYIATYLALRGQVPLAVLAVAEGDGRNPDPLAEAKAYLTEQDVTARYVRENGPVAGAILRTAEALDCDLILMGGYGHSPVAEIVLGSAVDEVLRHSLQPVLICR